MSMILLGVGLNFAMKENSGVERFIKLDNQVTKIDVNKATLKELRSIKGITLRLANNIIEYREIYGPFRNLQDLKEVKGIGEYRLNKIKDHLTIN